MVKEWDGKYIVRNYYRSNDALEMEAVCRSYTPTLIFDGEVKRYYADGTLKNSISYRDGKPEGIEKCFYANGSPRCEKIHKPYAELHSQYWSEEGKPFLTDGTGMVIDNYEKPMATYMEIKDFLLISAFSVKPGLNDTVYLVVKEPSTYQGGLEQLYKEIGEDLKGKYPKTARKAGIQGKVFVEFCVDVNGRVVDANVVRGIGGGCDQLALDVVRNRQRWTPAMHKGRPVKMKMILPIVFKLR